MFGTKEYQHWNELYLKVHQNAKIRYTADIWLKLRIKVLEKWLLYDQKIKLELPSDIIHKYIKTVFELRNLQQRFFKKYKDKQTPMILHKDSNELPVFQFFFIVCVRLISYLWLLWCRHIVYRYTVSFAKILHGLNLITCYW